MEKHKNKVSLLLHIANLTELGGGGTENYLIFISVPYFVSIALINKYFF